MGSFLSEKPKKIGFVWSLCRVTGAHGKVTIWPALNTKFAVCLDRAHGELTIVRRVPKPGAHGEPEYFAVCQSQGHTAKSSAAGPRDRFRHVPIQVAHGKVGNFGMCLLPGTQRSPSSRR